MILKSHPVVRMTTYKTRLQSQKQIERLLQESGIEVDDDVSSQSDSSSESESESESEDSAIDYSVSSNSEDTMPPAPKKQRKRVGSGL